MIEGNVNPAIPVAHLLAQGHNLAFGSVQAYRVSCLVEVCLLG